MTLSTASSSPLVSVVVPNYNHARFLPQRVDSVLGQTFDDFEVILLDDCSTDDSREILIRYQTDARVKLRFNEVNSGSTFKQWNKGAALATGKYIWFAESDDYADPAFLQRLTAKLQSDDRCTIAYCHSYDVDENSTVRGLLPQWIAYPDPAHWDSDFIASGELEMLTNFVWGTPIQNASAALFRRSAFLAVGGADESYRLAGDWKLYIDLLSIGDLAYVAEPLNYFRRHNVTVRSTSRSSGLDVEEGYRLFAHLRSKVTLPPSVAKRRLWQLARWRAGIPDEALSNEDRRRAISLAAERADPRAQWRLTAARGESKARATARSIRRLFRSDPVEKPG